MAISLPEDASPEALALLKQQNDALRASQEQLQLALQAAQMGVWDWELASGRVVWAGEHARLFGLKPEDFGGTIDAVQQCVHPDDREHGMTLAQRMLTDGCEFDNVYRVIWPDGSIHWLHSLGRLIRDCQGTAQRITGVTLDITAQREAERQMAALSAVVRHSDAIMVIKDLDRRVIATNPSFAKAAGYASEAELIGKTDAEIFGVSPDMEPVRSYMQDELEAQRLPPGASLVREEPVITRDGRELCYLTKKYPIHDGDGRVIATANISVDITQRRELEYQLLTATAEARALAERAEAANRAKSAFLANMSHEIRTPLHAVLGFCYLVEQHPLEPDVRELVGKIHNAGTSLLTLINDILDFSKIEAGHLHIEATPFRLSELLDTLAGIMNAAVGNKPLELILNPPEHGIEYLIGDSARLRQVLINLLGNAIKFTDCGEVELRITCLAQNADSVTLQFAVRDTGIGIDPAQQREIFAAFSQADTSINRRFGGTGLGLAISAQLVQLMGSDLRVESAPGVGSTFLFTLVLPRDPEARPLIGERIGLRLLVADDCATAGAALKHTAQALGWQVDWVDSGAAARARLLERIDTVLAYDAVIFDWRMPDEDGLCSAWALRSDLAAWGIAKPPLLLLMASPLDRPLLLSQPGFDALDGLLDKPVTPSALYNALVQRFSRRPPPPAQTLRQQPLAGVHVLVVDDSTINQEVAEGILVKQGAQVSVADDGEAALAWLAAHPTTAHIILMDVQMPRLDGYAATRLIRQDPRWETLPIIALTAGAFRTMQDAAQAAGMNDFIAKPFEVAHLVQCIERWVKCDPAAPPAATARALPPSATPPALDALSEYGIDTATALERWGDPKVYQGYLAKFRDSHADDAPAIAAALDSGAHATAAALAHKLTGVAATLALPRVAALARHLEQDVRRGDPIDPARLQGLGEAIASVCHGIRAWAGTVRAVPRAEPLTPDAIAALHSRLLAAIQQQHLRQAETLIEQLHTTIADDRLRTLQRHLSDFDFRAAEALTQTLIQDLALSRPE